MNRMRKLANPAPQTASAVSVLADYNNDVWSKILSHLPPNEFHSVLKAVKKKPIDAEEIIDAASRMAVESMVKTAEEYRKSEAAQSRHPLAVEFREAFANDNSPFGDRLRRGAQQRDEKIGQPVEVFKGETWEHLYRALFGVLRSLKLGDDQERVALAVSLVTGSPVFITDRTITLEEDINWNLKKHFKKNNARFYAFLSRLSKVVSRRVALKQFPSSFPGIGTESIDDNHDKLEYSIDGIILKLKIHGLDSQDNRWEYSHDKPVELIRLGRLAVDKAKERYENPPQADYQNTRRFATLFSNDLIRYIYARCALGKVLASVAYRQRHTRELYCQSAEHLQAGLDLCESQSDGDPLVFTVHAQLLRALVSLNSWAGPRFYADSESLPTRRNFVAEEEQRCDFRVWLRHFKMRTFRWMMKEILKPTSSCVLDEDTIDVLRQWILLNIVSLEQGLNIVAFELGGGDLEVFKYDDTSVLTLNRAKWGLNSYQISKKDIETMKNETDMFVHNYVMLRSLLFWLGKHSRTRLHYLSVHRPYSELVDWLMSECGEN